MSTLRQKHPAQRQDRRRPRLVARPRAAGRALHADTRSLAAGDAFFAYAVDGADNRPFIDGAIERGAAAVLVQPEGFSGATDRRTRCAVPALNELAGSIASGWYNDPSEAMLTVGITGTNGKTSCSQWISAALTALGTPLRDHRHARHRDCRATSCTPASPRPTHRNCNAVSRNCATAGAQAVAMEVSSHALHQGRVNGTAFDIAVFTNLTQDHLDYHDTFEPTKRRRRVSSPGRNCVRP